MNELNDIDNSITSRQPHELIRIIFYGDCKFKTISTNRFWFQLSNSSKIVTDLIIPKFSLQKQLKGPYLATTNFFATF